jgi:hypothetical protein
MREIREIQAQKFRHLAAYSKTLRRPEINQQIIMPKAEN